MNLVQALERMDSGLVAVQATVEGARVLGTDHPAVRERAGMASTLLEAAASGVRAARGMAAGAGVGIVCFDGRVACMGQQLPQSDRHARGLFATLASLGQASLVIAGAASSDDVLAFARALVEGDRAGVTGGARLRASGVDVLVGGGSGTREQVVEATTPAELEPERVREPLEGAWNSIQTGQSIPMEAIDELADRVRGLASGFGREVQHLAKLKAHDHYTFVHTINVSILSASLAQACGLKDSDVRAIAVGAMLHDVGKNLVPEEILNKKGKLEDSDLAILRRHPLDGARLLIDAGNAPDLAVVIAYEHHMHLNGTGYPAIGGLHRPHLASQIVQVADIFDALRTNRPYRAGMPTQKAFEIMMQGAGTTHDKALLDWFFERIARFCPDVNAPAAPGRAA